MNNTDKEEYKNLYGIQIIPNVFILFCVYLIVLRRNLALAGGLFLGLGGGGLGDQHRVDVGENTSLGDGHTAEQLVQLFVVADGQLDVAGNNAGLFVVSGSIAGKLKHLGSEVLKDGSQVHRGTRTNTSCVLALL
eukprot:CAMPEP_0184967284 /NCGR_PEP_ID=MMETSP1098-20130426/708_1 /TAXON_ID=89044 /ORGANISM="Spumella elongata, Strain CCAP 955/1" /LENGTH=134 /DNA_ID=CAMNT_0027488711 /DNA_START=34 /DNA_END=438 /DNA_ORIENTATION=-